MEDTGHTHSIKNCIYSEYVIYFLHWTSNLNKHLIVHSVSVTYGRGEFVAVAAVRRVEVDEPHILSAVHRGLCRKQKYRYFSLFSSCMELHDSSLVIVLSVRFSPKGKSSLL